MKLHEALKLDVNRNTLVIVAKEDGETVAIAQMNHKLGLCDCCPGWIDSNQTIIKAFDAVTGEIYYEAANETD